MKKEKFFYEVIKMKDLTKGKPSRLILAFALPIFLANLLQLTIQPGGYPDCRIVSGGRCTLQLSVLQVH